MDVEFVNRYTVSREGQKAYFIDPTRRRAERYSTPPSTGGGKRGTVVRWAGLAMAIGIMVISIAGKMWIFFFMGLVLAMIYGLRISQLRSQQQTVDERQAQRLEELIALQQAPKWTRFVRFGNFIETEDPGSWKQYKYDQVTRISQDRAYITLWMDDDTQVRVYKDGFIIGTLEGFEPFIEQMTHIPDIPEQPAGPESREEEDAQEGPDEKTAGGPVAAEPEPAHAGSDEEAKS